MIRTGILLISMLIGVSAYAESIQELRPDKSSPSLLDLSNGERGWGEPEKEAGSPGVYGGSTTPRSGVFPGAPRTQPVSGYIRKNGTVVAPYMRSPARR